LLTFLEELIMGFGIILKKNIRNWLPYDITSIT
jgi:hypothetical protein